MDNKERGILIIAGIANIAIAVKKNLSKEDLISILHLFGQKTVDGKKEYDRPGFPVDHAIKYFSEKGDTATAENIRLVFGSIDITLLD